MIRRWRAYLSCQGRTVPRYIVGRAGGTQRSLSTNEFADVLHRNQSNQFSRTPPPNSVPPNDSCPERKAKSVKAPSRSTPPLCFRSIYITAQLFGMAFRSYLTTLCLEACGESRRRCSAVCCVCSWTSRITMCWICSEHPFECASQLLLPLHLYNCVIAGLAQRGVASDFGGLDGVSTHFLPHGNIRPPE